MKYKHVTGPVYCRYAATPPIVNSSLANEYGIEARSFVELEQDRNVKVSILLEDRTRRMTCHAKVAWVQRDDEAGGAFDERWVVGLSPLSLTDDEFQVLLANFVEAPLCPIEFREHVRDVEGVSAPVTFPGREELVVRVKALTMSVSLIDEIDSKRGRCSVFSVRYNSGKGVFEKTLNRVARTDITTPGKQHLGVEFTDILLRMIEPVGIPAPLAGSDEWYEQGHQPQKIPCVEAQLVGSARCQDAADD